MSTKFWKAEYNDFGVLERYYWDATTEEMTIRKTTDVTDVLTSNKARANATIDTRFGKEMMHHVAEIPLGVVVKWKKDYNIDILSGEEEDMKRAAKLLDDPEWQYLKTTVRFISRRRAGTQ